MREIIFRGKRVDNGEWCYGYLLQPNIISNVVSGQLEYADLFVNENTVGQYTGRKDKNDKKIFDGDIVIGNFPYGEKGVIVWDEKSCGFYILPYWEHGVGRAGNDKYYKMNAAKLEIIGNIFDNPIYLK